MADLKKIADAARDYMRFLCATGHRHDNRETLMFCEAIEAADAPPAVVVDPVAADAPPPLPPLSARVDAVMATVTEPKEG